MQTLNWSDLVVIPEHDLFVSWLQSADALCLEELLRWPDHAFQSAFLRTALAGGDLDNQRVWVRESAEWKDKHPPEPEEPELRVVPDGTVFRLQKE